MKKKQQLSLPNILQKEWKITDLLSQDAYKKVYLLQKRTEDTFCILEVLRKKDFSAKKYKKVSLLSDEYLLLPEKYIYHRGYCLIFYSKRTTLKEILYGNGLSLKDIFQLGIDLSYGAEELTRKQFYCADINPSNIYRKDNGIFCLGDLDIGKISPVGTPDYMPSIHHSKFPFRKESMKNNCNSFDSRMQYAIGKLLLSVLQCRKEYDTKEIISIPIRACSPTPEERYSSLAEFRKEMKILLRSVTEVSYPILRLTDKRHTLFQTKTIKISYNKNPFFYPLLWSALLTAGCIFLTVFYNSLHSDNQSISSDIKAELSDINSPSPSEGKLPDIDSGFSAKNHSDINCGSSEEKSPETDSGSSEKKYSGINSGSSEEKSPETDSGSSGKNYSGTDSGSSGKNYSDINSSLEKISRYDLDIQKKGISSFEKILRTTADKDKILYLYAGENQLTNISSVRSFPHLKELYLNRNRLCKIDPITQLRELEVLIVSYNEIKQLPDLSGLKHLSHLDLSSNSDFNDIKTLAPLKNLRLLNISDTAISEKKYQSLRRQLPQCNIIY